VLAPDLYLTSVRDIDLDALKARGVDTLLMDLDNTLLPRDSSIVPADIVGWTREIKASGIRVCFVSNNWHERVHAVAEELGFEIVAKAVKPLPFAFLAALKRMGARRRQAAIVGDQLFTDVLGGKLLGVMTILVLPLSASDLPHTLFLRKIERVLLAGRRPQAPARVERTSEGGA
jgi:HAD superfamily phosphatase (TIGR01668 family)